MEFKKRVENAFKQWEENGFCQEARELNDALGEEYFNTANPLFFTGDINSELVLVHLNPKHDEENWNKKCEFKNFDAYWDFYSKFGKNHYGEESRGGHKSRFDHKQVRFLRPFNLLSINTDDKFKNLENVMDQKLQIELVPYGSPEFSYHKIGIEKLKPFVEHVQSLIMERPRKYVIFCGKVFEKIFSDSIKPEDIHEFYLTNKDGQPTKNKYRVVNFVLEQGDKRIPACIAPQFAQQGCPSMEYGKKVKELYGI